MIYIVGTKTILESVFITGGLYTKGTLSPIFTLVVFTDEYTKVSE